VTTLPSRNNAMIHTIARQRTGSTSHNQTAMNSKPIPKSIRVTTPQGSAMM